MNLKLIINIKDIDKNGNVFEENEFEANSLVKGFIGNLASQMQQGVNQTVIRTTGYSNPTSNNAENFVINAAADFSGIVVGSDNTAVTIDDYALGTKIEHGTGAGQLEYSANEMSTNFTVSGSNAYFEFRRTFTNNSGNDVTIHEIGLYVGNENYISSTQVCIDRTLSTTTVTNGNGKVITYKFQVTV